jgi:hypothetical protein
MTEKIEKDVTVSLVVSQLNTDPLQYKPYSPTFLPKDVTVQIQVPVVYVISSKEGIILTPKGLGYVCKILAQGISEAFRDED